jgi:hypothetical protein
MVISPRGGFMNRCIGTLVLLVAIMMPGAAGCVEQQQQRAVRFYGGDALPADKVSTLWYMEGSRISVVSIDEHSFDGYCDRSDANICVIQILPGRHTMAALFGEEKDGRFMMLGGDMKVDFEVEAGKFYSVSAVQGSLLTLEPVRTWDWTVKFEPTGDPNKPVGE